MAASFPPLGEQFWLLYSRAAFILRAKSPVRPSYILFPDGPDWIIHSSERERESRRPLCYFGFRAEQRRDESCAVMTGKLLLCWSGAGRSTGNRFRRRHHRSAELGI